MSPTGSGSVRTPVRLGGLGPVIGSADPTGRGSAGCRGSQPASEGVYAALTTPALALWYASGHSTGPAISYGVPQPPALHHRSPIELRLGAV